MTVRTGSRLGDEATVSPGPPARCDGSPAAATASELLARLTTLLQRVPTALRPADIQVHLDPTRAPGVEAVRTLQYHRGSGSLLSLASATALPASVWLHELAHVKLAAALPEAPLERALQSAWEEGVADYFAAAVGASPLLGPFGAATDTGATGLRDLSQPPTIYAGDWESLALPGVRFESRRLGWALAAAAWRTEPRAGGLLADLLTCGGAAVAARSAQGCPARSRTAVQALLRGWLPAGWAR